MGFEGCRGSGEVDDACWLICVAWNGRGEQGGGEVDALPFLPHTPHREEDDEEVPVSDFEQQHQHQR